MPLLSFQAPNLFAHRRLTPVEEEIVKRKSERHTKEPEVVASGREEVIPVMEEELHVGKRTVTTGKATVRKVVREREEVVDEPLLQEEIVVERHPVNRFVDTPPPIHQKGTTTIIPLLEEVMVIEKRLLFREEVHIGKKREMVRKPERVVLRSEQAIIEHSDEPERKH